MRKWMMRFFVTEVGLIQTKTKTTSGKEERITKVKGSKLIESPFPVGLGCVSTEREREKERERERERVESIDMERRQ